MGVHHSGDTMQLGSIIPAFFETIDQRTHMKGMKSTRIHENPSKIDSNNTAIDDMQ